MDHVIVLADRPAAVTALTRIFLDEIERLLGAAVGLVPDADSQPTTRPRLGAVSFLHRFGSGLNRHMHVHACVTDGVFVATDAPDGVAFLPARPISSGDLAALAEPLEPPRSLPPAGRRSTGSSSSKRMTIVTSSKQPPTSSP